MLQKVINEVKNDEKYIYEQIFKEFFFLSYSSKQNINNEIVKHINVALIELKKDINRKNIPKNENPEKIVKKILNFNNQQKGKGHHVC